jgi:hypothetical protein
MITPNRKNKTLDSNFLHVKVGTKTIQLLYDYSSNCFEKDTDKHFEDILDEAETELKEKDKINGL